MPNFGDNHDPTVLESSPDEIRKQELWERYRDEYVPNEVGLSVPDHLEDPDHIEAWAKRAGALGFREWLDHHGYRSRGQD